MEPFISYCMLLVMLIVVDLIVTCGLYPFKTAQTEIALWGR